MSLNKTAAEAVNMLMDQGVDFESASGLVMEKVAGTGASIYFRGAAETERRIAKKHGQEGPEKGIWSDYEINNAANGKATGRGVLTGAVAGVASYEGARALANRAIRRGATSVPKGQAFSSGLAGIGALAGYAGGMATSFKNQGKKMEQRYQEKQAAVNMLVEEGVDFDSAVELVNSKSENLYGY